MGKTGCSTASTKRWHRAPESRVKPTFPIPPKKLILDTAIRFRNCRPKKYQRVRERRPC